MERMMSGDCNGKDDDGNSYDGGDGKTKKDINTCCSKSFRK